MLVSLLGAGPPWDDPPDSAKEYLSQPRLLGSPFPFLLSTL